MHEGPIYCYQMQRKNFRLESQLSDFWSSYAFQALLSLGSRIKAHLNWQLYQRIADESRESQGDQYPNHRCYLKLMAVYLRACADRFFDILSEYDQVEALPSSTLHESWSYVPRIYLTPCGIYPMVVKPIRTNRVLREQNLFGPNEHFCRVMLRDVDLCEPQADFTSTMKDWIVALILGHKRLTIGNKSFEFLLSSNSQLRDRSFWFYAGYKNQNAAGHSTVDGRFFRREMYRQIHRSNGHDAIGNDSNDSSECLFSRLRTNEFVFSLKKVRWTRSTINSMSKAESSLMERAKSPVQLCVK